MYNIYISLLIFLLFIYIYDFWKTNKGFIEVFWIDLWVNFRIIVDKENIWNHWKISVIINSDPSLYKAVWDWTCDYVHVININDINTMW